MASTRQERQQMRQRGAATRKTKAVDFGFSFGGPALGFPEPSQPSIVPEPVLPPQTETAPVASAPASQPEPQTDKPQRTPGSARNQLPQRPSTYDIPSDEQPRSNKRRKINPPDATGDIPSHKQTDGSSKNNLPSAPNGTELQNNPKKAWTTDGPQPEPAHDMSPIQSPLAVTQMHNEQADVENSAVNGTEAEAPTSAKQAQTTTTTPNRARTSGSKSLVTDSQSTAGLPRNIERQEKQQQTGPPTAESSTMTNNDESPEIGKQTRPRLSRKGGNQSTSADDREINSGRSQLPNAEQAIPEPARETQYMPEDAPSGGSAKVKRKGARISPAKRPTNTETESRPQSPIESAPTTGKSSAAGARRGRKPTKKAEIQAAPEPEARAEPAEIEESGSRRGKAGRKATKTAEHKSAAASKPTASQTEPEPAPQPLVEEPSPAAEPEISKNRRGRPGKKAKVGSEPQRPADSHSDPQPESPPEPEPEVEEPAHVLEQETLPRSSNKRHDKPGNKSKRAPRPEEAPPEEHTEAEAPQETQRKPREPRGETVPVTVHRLANAAALGGTYASVDDSGDEREGSPDEISTRQKTKIPSRGGVNPADVLGQICRETLEKTLATLKTGIENESNPTRRAEWSRKRKAVESFGMELDGRLLDLSEMLDSNFVLGVQLKKAKRDMMDLRSHLHQVRREREAIALQMDRVRSKHMEEEQETTARSTINNSIHSLELALDRSQHRASSSAETSSTELEFLLRTVAEEVSCRAPGAQGGLLHQIRSLNAQLEATARQLERQ